MFCDTCQHAGADFFAIVKHDNCPQPGFFDLENRGTRLTAMGDPLVELNALIDREAFRPDLRRIHVRERRSGYCLSAFMNSSSGVAWLPMPIR